MKITENYMRRSDSQQILPYDFFKSPKDFPLLLDTHQDMCPSY